MGNRQKAEHGMSKTHNKVKTNRLYRVPSGRYHASID
jgi:hypothetical protein